jgi:hypothetical protein
VDLATYAKDWLHEQTQKKYGECGWSPEEYAFNQDFRAIIDAANHVVILSQTKTDWKSKLLPFNDTLYGVGVLSKQLLEYST